LQQAVINPIQGAGKIPKGCYIAMEVIMLSTNEQSVGQQIKTLRQRFGLTRRELSNALSISEITLLRSENLAGHKNLPLVERQLQRILKILLAKLKAEPGGTDE
jgi:ribosome-binding protein aMBF1 (putative translation factor)